MFKRITIRKKNVQISKTQNDDVTRKFRKLFGDGLMVQNDLFKNLSEYEIGKD